MICRFCGKEIEEGSPICNHCAKPVPSVYNECANQEEVTLKEKELEQQNKLDKSNKESIRYAKYSLWFNGISYIPAVLCGFCHFNYIKKISFKILGENPTDYCMYIPDFIYQFVAVITVPLAICILCGIICGIISVCICNKNKISKVAITMTIVTILSILLYLMAMYAVLNIFGLAAFVGVFIEIIKGYSG